jgi:hypothetical protein
MAYSLLRRNIYELASSIAAMDDLYAIILSWALTLSGYPAPNAAPEVVRVPHADLIEKACGGRECKVLGWFPPGDRIFLDERLNPKDNLYASSILLHEMVHYLQHHSGRFPAPYPCATALELEREAYGIQREYLLRYGVYQPVGVSMHFTGCELTVEPSEPDPQSGLAH